MSEEMAVSDIATGDEAAVETREATLIETESDEVTSAQPTESAAPAPEDIPTSMDGSQESPILTPEEPETKNEEKTDPPPEVEAPTVKTEPTEEQPDNKEVLEPPLTTVVDSVIKTENDDLEPVECKPPTESVKEDHSDDKKGIKRRASSTFRGVDDEFKGFDDSKEGITKVEGYSRVLERLEAEVTAATKDFIPLRIVMATPSTPVRAIKRPRKDTDGSRPSSALSSRSDGDGTTDVSATTSPASRGRRATTEISSPLLRVPLERGWKRELVYRAALDAHSRRNADIYYYTPRGKKLRSCREISENLSGTGLTLENFSFFKEPLGVDDPEKEIIRDAKVGRRVESPISAPTPSVEGKRTPKPKPAKGASPETAPAKSAPAKIKVKSVGSRLNNSATAQTPPAKQQKKPQPATTPSAADNNNTAPWKKPSACAARPPAQPPPQHPPPPPLQSRPAPPATATKQVRAMRPCSMACGRGVVPSLSCYACLCLYHPACVGYTLTPPPRPFLCKNCCKSSSPPLEPPPLTHKSGVTVTSTPVPVPVATPVPAAVPKRANVPLPVPVPAKVPRDKRVLLRMKVASGGADGERVWAVAGSTAAAAPAPAPAPVPPVTKARAPRPSLPQTLVTLNGRRFIVVPRSMVHTTTQ